MFGGKQIKFPPNQTHRRGFEVFMVGLCLVCIVVVIILIYTIDGAFIGPW